MTILKILSKTLVFEFISKLKFYIYDFLESEKRLNINFFKVKDYIILSFEEIVINHSLEFVINNTEYKKSINDNITIMLNDFLNNLEQTYLIKESSEFSKEKKAEYDFLINNFKNDIEEELINNYEEFINKDWALLFSKNINN